jgi:glycosyltransferase involved in cell wall biosynthesis
MPVYTAQRYLHEAIDSVLAQTMGDLELVISDNASTDATAEICREYVARDPRVRYFRNAANLGVVANFNLAFTRSRGVYFKWAAYDDLHAPTYLERCAAVLDERGDVAVSHSLTRSIDDAGRDRGEFPAAYRLDVAHAPERFRRVIWTDAFPPIWGLMRAAAIRRTKLHEPYMGSDRNFMAEMVLRGGVAYVPEPLFLLREHAGSYTSSVKDYYQRLSWYAPGRRVPSWMQIPVTARGYVGAIARAPLAWSDKVACFRHVSEWVGTCAGQLVRRKLGGRAAGHPGHGERGVTVDAPRKPARAVGYARMSMLAATGAASDLADVAAAFMF